MLHRLLSIASLFVLMTGGAQAGDWPAFRGPNGNGTSEETGFPLHWGQDRNVVWRAALPAPANSSPIVSSDRVFVTYATDRGRERTLACFDRTDGSRLWRRTVPYGKIDRTHRTNPYCGSTPVSDGRRVIVWHGSAGLFCYDPMGDELWSIDLGDINHVWGYGSSPIIHRDMVLLNFGPGDETFMAAVDLETGTLVWKTPEPGGADDKPAGRWIGSWSTPVVAEVDGEEQILCSMPTRVVAYDPGNGQVLWSCWGLPSDRGDLVYTSPLIAGGYGVAMGGFGGPAIGFELGGGGDMTERNRLWRTSGRQPQRIGSGVIIDGYIYMANAGPGTAECMELETGKQRWQARLVGGSSWGSLCYVDGRLYVTGQNGTTSVFLPNPEEFESVAENRLGEPSNATPAFSDGQIFLRTDRALYCIGNN